MIRYMKSSYYLLLLGVITLTLRVYMKEILNNTILLNVKMDKVNNLLNKKFNSLYIFEDGNLDILTVINCLISFVLGLYFNNQSIKILIYVLFIESLVIYDSKNGKLVINLIMMILFNIIGMIFCKKRKKDLENIDIYN